MNGARPEWDQFGETFELVGRYLSHTLPGQRARLDQVDAEIRDYYDRLGLCLADDWTSFTALATSELLACQVLNATRYELIDLRSARAVHSLLIANAAMFTEPARRTPC